ncbi:MAG: CDP-glucose 4,6-dehydratase [Bacteroidales bacterium]|jgi:CDP-glucose 4,6-dehydratase|nr:CDP-glucose 4,6-dehydratase [Bacteroidales bacterium]
MVDLEKTYKGKKVFLTGHTGFKGAYLTKILSLLGAEVMGYSLKPNTNPNLYSILNIKDLCCSIIADVRQKEVLKKHIMDFRPDFIFHLAAQPLVLDSYKEPAYTFDVNVIGTANLLEAVRDMNKPNCNTLIVTTDKVYKNEEKNYAYKETDLLGGYDPYSASKAATEILINSFRSSFFNPKEKEKHNNNKVVSLRAGNVIGGGDWAENRLIPDIVRAIHQNIEIEVRNPEAIRPWQHVFEPLYGYLFAGKFMEEEKLFEEAINFGPYQKDTLKVKDIVEMAILIWGEGKYRIIPQNNALHEANNLQLDINRAISLGWKPLWDAKTAIENTIIWYKTYYSNEAEIENLTTNQICQYFKIKKD